MKYSRIIDENSHDVCHFGLSLTPYPLTKRKKQSGHMRLGCVGVKLFGSIFLFVTEEIHSKVKTPVKVAWSLAGAAIKSKLCIISL